MLKLEIHPGAEADYNAALEWYLQRSRGAALRFEHAVDQALNEIRAAPHRWARCDQVHRMRRVKRYPHYVIYRVEANAVLVVAVAHARRRPDYWKDRD
ncbi:MAG: type II toxin-antitoxin system RelE/ParE family toxin [Planctomycetia bacterium]|nr:type II toxin-antitoxin system RelE/ParE family toxin [Planctomycetia bacterium]